MLISYVRLDHTLYSINYGMAFFLQVIHQSICGSRLIAPFRRYVVRLSIVFDVIIINFSPIYLYSGAGSL